MQRFYPQLGIGTFAQFLGQTAVVGMGEFGDLTVQIWSVQRGHALIKHFVQQNLGFGGIWRDPNLVYQ